MKKINVAIIAMLFIGSTGNLLRASDNSSKEYNAYECYKAIAGAKTDEERRNLRMIYFWVTEIQKERQSRNDRMSIDSYKEEIRKLRGIPEKSIEEQVAELKAEQNSFKDQCEALRAKMNQKNSDLKSLIRLTATNQVDPVIAVIIEEIEILKKMPATRETREMLNLKQEAKSILEHQRNIIQSDSDFGAANPDSFVNSASLQQKMNRIGMQLMALKPELDRQYNLYTTSQSTLSSSSSSQPFSAVQAASSSSSLDSSYSLGSSTRAAAHAANEKIDQKRREREYQVLSSCSSSSSAQSNTQAAPSTTMPRPSSSSSSAQSITPAAQAMPATPIYAYGYNNQGQYVGATGIRDANGNLEEID